MVRVLAVDANNLGVQINYEITSGTIDMQSTLLVRHFCSLGNIGNVFSIESDGLIVTSGNIDRETRSRYILTVQVLVYLCLFATLYNILYIIWLGN